jgi:hypothetical protein
MAKFERHNLTGSGLDRSGGVMRIGAKFAFRCGLIAAASACVVLAACRHDPIQLPKPPRITSQDQAGTVLVSTTFVGPWEEVAPSLSPGFSVNGTLAANAVLPTTEQINQQGLSSTALAFSAAAGLVATNSTATNGLNNVTNSVPPPTNAPAGTPQQVTTTTTTNSTQSTTTTSQNLAPPTTSTPTTLPSLPAAVALGVDPEARLNAATDYNVYAQLLNQFVSQAALRKCYVPYVVKLKLAFIPYVNPVPYSAHTLINFFPENAASKPDPDPTLGKGCADPQVVPQVVPFLAADDLQLAASANAYEVARQIALAASALAHGVTLSENFSHLYESLTAIENEKLHSTLTVSRTVDNGLYVLLSPENQASGQAELVGRTYDVALLLLVPRSYFAAACDGCGSAPHDASMSVVTFTQFRNAYSGRVLATRPDSSIIETLNRDLGGFGITVDEANLSATQEELEPLLRAIERGDYASFQTSAPGLARRADDGALWTALTQVILDASFKSTEVVARVPAPISIPSQNAAVTDSGAGAMTVTLYGVEGRPSSTLAAKLMFGSDSGQTLAAQSVALDPNVHTLTMTFASATQAGVPKPAAGSALAATLAVWEVGCNDPQVTLCPQLVTKAPLTVTIASKSAAGFQLGNMGSTVMFDATGAATLPIVLKQVDSGVTVGLSVSGATVTAVSAGQGGGAVSAIKSDGYEVGQAGVYNLTLPGLTAGTIITVTASGSRAGGPSGADTHVFVAMPAPTPSKGSGQ